METSWEFYPIDVETGLFSNYSNIQNYYSLLNQLLIVEEKCRIVKIELASVAQLCNQNRFWCFNKIFQALKY